MRKFGLLLGLAVGLAASPAAATDILTPPTIYTPPPMAAPVFTPSIWYVEVLAGGAIPYKHDFSWNGDSEKFIFKKGFGLGAAVGRYLSPNTRADLGLAWAHGWDGVDYEPGFPPDPHSGSIDTLTLALNYYYEFAFHGPFRPFLGAGLGLTYISFNRVGSGGDYSTDSDFTYTLLFHAGLDYPLANGRHILTGRYTLAYNGETNYDGYGSNTFKIDGAFEHAFTVGIRTLLN